MAIAEKDKYFYDGIMVEKWRIFVGGENPALS